ncbi:short-chain dehydrogenase [Fusarium albosuccineum]|uniref:Short-chain dehydrogenase n=1 Tax=Fusarium albosuccineum TaxID=1237068 RepID=A0A8H4PHR1_9HYPO|nr:short-chain dehydrogenase [Fusarium albosuccineum]
MSSSKTYLITGAGCGIGKELTTKLLLRPGVTVVAAVRDTSRAGPSLTSLPKGEGSRLILVKIDSQADTDAAVAVSQLQEEHGVTSLDIVIANAGIAHSGTTVSSTSPDAFRDHINTNAIGPVTLFQAVSPLLKASQIGNPIFLPISTIFGSIGGQDYLSHVPPIMSPYGASKTALNWIVHRIHLEEEWLTTFVVHPGLVLTDMGFGILPPGADPAALGALTVPESVAGLLKPIDSASREKHGGTFQNVDGTPLPW